MRNEFWKQLYELMKTNNDVWLLVGDLGYNGADKIKKDFPDRFINCGAAEFSMVGIAAGLALEGKIPFCYTITSFYLRAFEMIRTYIDHEKIPVILVGSGRDKEYTHDGYSHDATDIWKLFALCPNIKQRIPTRTDGVKNVMDQIMSSRQPTFLSLSKTL